MKVRNITVKIPSVGGSFTIDAEPASWGGYCVTLRGRVAGYYDIKILEQIHSKDGRTHTMGFTPDEAKAIFRDSEVSYFCTKPWHDESDSMTDYCAWSFCHRLKDIDWCVQNAKGLHRAPTA